MVSGTQSMVSSEQAAPVTSGQIPTPLAYEDAKRLARDGDAKIRHAIASHAQTRPEILYYLAEDPDAEVRRCIAENRQTPRQADVILARDENEEVRCVLAGKIGHLFPETTSAERAAMRRAVIDVLEILAADEAARVRGIVSDALKDVDDAPHNLILHLAGDAELAVCGPVLEFSPVLSSEDLIALIESAPVQGALAAISRRKTVTEPVSDAIAVSRDCDAVASLLANPSAQIREETLDRLIDDAPDNESWHEPLILRPALPAGPARRVAEIVARSLLDTLRARTDLDPQTLAGIAEVVESRLDGDPLPEAGNAAEPDWKSERDPRKRVQLMAAEGALDEEAVSTAASEGDRAFVCAALALRCGLQEESVDRILSANSARAIVALCWKARYSMQLAIRLQFTIGKIPPREILRASGPSEYPLSQKELAQQLTPFESGS